MALTSSVPGPMGAWLACPLCGLRPLTLAALPCPIGPKMYVFHFAQVLLCVGVTLELVKYSTSNTGWDFRALFCGAGCFSEAQCPASQDGLQFSTQLRVAIFLLFSCVPPHPALQHLGLVLGTALSSGKAKTIVTLQSAVVSGLEAQHQEGTYQECVPPPAVR